MQKITISLKSFDYSCLKKSLSQISQLTQILGNIRMEKQILPKLKKRFTLLRSPHIDKKSREQFELVEYKGLVVVLTWSAEKTSFLSNGWFFLFLIKESEFPGVSMVFYIKSSTYLGN